MRDFPRLFEHRIFVFGIVITEININRRTKHEHTQKRKEERLSPLVVF